MTISFCNPALADRTATIELERLQDFGRLDCHCHVLEKMLGQGPVCHGEGQSTSLHLVTGDAINTNEYCLLLRLAALLGKSRIEISSAFLHG